MQSRRWTRSMDNFNWVSRINSKPPVTGVTSFGGGAPVGFTIVSLLDPATPQDILPDPPTPTLQTGGQPPHLAVSWSLAWPSDPSWMMSTSS